LRVIQTGDNHRAITTPIYVTYHASASRELHQDL